MSIVHYDFSLVCTAFAAQPESLSIYHAKEKNISKQCDGFMLLCRMSNIVARDDVNVAAWDLLVDRGAVLMAFALPQPARRLFRTR